MSLDLTDWIAVGSIALPLIAKACTEYQANTTAQHNSAMARIVGMAGRQAATIARTLAEMPPTANAKSVEISLVRNASTAILSEMGSSSATVGADADRLASIVQGELDKVGPMMVVNEPVSVPHALPSTPA